MAKSPTKDQWKNQLSRPEKRGKMITTRLPESLVASIDAIAAANKTTRTAIVQFQLETFVAGQKPAPAGTGLFE